MRMRKDSCRWQQAIFNPLFAVIISKVPNRTANSHLTSPSLESQACLQVAKEVKRTLNFSKIKVERMILLCACTKSDIARRGWDTLNAHFSCLILSYSTKAERSVESVSKEISTSDSGRCSCKLLLDYYDMHVRTHTLTHSLIHTHTLSFYAVSPYSSQWTTCLMANKQKVKILILLAIWYCTHCTVGIFSFQAAGTYCTRVWPNNQRTQQTDHHIPGEDAKIKQNLQPSSQTNCLEIHSPLPPMSKQFILGYIALYPTSACLIGSHFFYVMRLVLILFVNIHYTCVHNAYSLSWRIFQAECRRSQRRTLGCTLSWSGP